MCAYGANPERYPGLSGQHLRGYFSAMELGNPTSFVLLVWQQVGRCSKVEGCSEVVLETARAEKLGAILASDWLLLRYLGSSRSGVSKRLTACIQPVVEERRMRLRGHFGGRLSWTSRWISHYLLRCTEQLHRTLFRGKRLPPPLEELSLESL